jgi:hypothetical protein
MEISRAAVAARNCNSDMSEAAGQVGPSHAAGDLQDSLVAILSRSQIGEQERAQPARGLELEVQ